jgi:hypothetical protein
MEERHRERWKDCRLFERWSSKDKMEQDRSWVAWDWEGMSCSCYTTAPADACEILGSIRGESPTSERRFREILRTYAAACER